MTITPAVKPIVISIGACLLTMSGNSSTTTTEKTTPAVKCKITPRAALEGGLVSAMRAPKIIASEGIIARVNV